jgi:hypothetical protein
MMMYYLETPRGCINALIQLQILKYKYVKRENRYHQKERYSMSEKQKEYL